MFKTLVISGGSTKGIMALGALHFIQSMCSLREIKSFYGTSVGALISLLIAIGHQPVELAYFFQEINFSLNLFVTKKDCQVFDYDGFVSQIEKLILKKTNKLLTLEELYAHFGKEVHFVAFNYTRGRTEVLSRRTQPNLSCVEAVKLSCALPVVFKKCTLGGDLYLDGGLVNNFPLDLAFEAGEEAILAVKMDSNWKASSGDNIITIINNSVFVPITFKMRELEEKYKDRCALISLVSDAPMFKLKISDGDMLQMLIEGFLTSYFYFKLAASKGYT